MNQINIKIAGHDSPLNGHRVVIALLVFAYALSFADRMILSILFPSIQSELGISDTKLGVLGGLSFAIFYATLGIPIARLADKYSRTIIIAVSVAVFSLMTFLSGFANGFLMLLAFRIGVGIGEAGVNPASHSLIADYYPVNQRAFAMAVLMLGANLGMIVGFVGGGIIAENYGWRYALMTVGLPGLLLSGLILMFLKEPARGTFEKDKIPDESTSSLSESAKALLGNAAIRQLVLASTITSSLGYGAAQWLPTILTRTYDLPPSKTGLIMACLFGLLGAIGSLVSGKAADRLSTKGHSYGVWMIASAMLLAVPFTIGALLVDSLFWALVLFAIPAFTGNFYLGPTFALVQTLAPVSMRALASAIVMLSINLVGLGLGPMTIGYFSDVLSAWFGNRSLNIALAAYSVVGIWGAFHYWKCGKILLLNKENAD